MVICSNCGEETREGKFCANCGQPLGTGDGELSKPLQEQTTQDEVNPVTEHEISGNTLQTQNNQVESVQQQYNQQNYNQQGYNQQGYNNYQQNNPTRPLNQKNKIVGLILNILFVGLGYAYVGKWGEGLVLFVLYVILVVFSFLIIPAILAIALWIYTLIKTNDMIDKYNQGLPY